MLHKLRFFFKSHIKFESKLYNILKNIYYFIKKNFDYIVFKINYPKAFWIVNFSRNKKETFSQYGQDLLLLQLLGNSKKYVEVGANHPIRLNNTYLLEKSGWEGISIDPLKKYVNEWLSIRKNKFYNFAVGNKKLKKTFIEFYGNEEWIDMLSGFREYVRKEDLKSKHYKEYIVEVVKLEHICPFKEFDLLLIDVEGAEFEVLKGIDLNKFNVSYILIENDFKLGGSKKVRKYLESLGYVLVGRIGCSDDFFVKKQKFNIIFSKLKGIF